MFKYYTITNALSARDLVDPTKKSLVCWSAKENSQGFPTRFCYVDYQIALYCKAVVLLKQNLLLDS